MMKVTSTVTMLSLAEAVKVSVEANNAKKAAKAGVAALAMAGAAQAACPEDAVIEGDLVLTDDMLDEFAGINCDAVEQVTGNVIANGTQALAIFLANLGEIGGDAEFTGNEGIFSINLPALASAGGNVGIVNNLNLRSFNLNNLQEAGRLSIVNHPFLSLYELPRLAKVDDLVQVANNPNLKELDLELLESAGDVQITGNAGLKLNNGEQECGPQEQEPDESYDCRGLFVPSLTESGSIQLSNNDALAGVQAANLRAINGGLDIQENGALQTVDFQNVATLGDEITLVNNANLEELNLQGIEVGAANFGDRSGNCVTEECDDKCIVNVGGDELPCNSE